MDVSQSRTFEFDGNFTLMMIPLGSDVDFSANSATLSTGSQEITLEEVPFQTAWRTSGGASFSGGGSGSFGGGGGFGDGGFGGAR